MPKFALMVDDQEIKFLRELLTKFGDGPIKTNLVRKLSGAKIALKRVGETTLEDVYARTKKH